MKPTREQLDAESLSRAQNGNALTNYPAILSGFAAKGIPLDAIQPRENIFTYRAWRAKGRQVRRGEHGVKVVSYRPVDRKVERDGREVVETKLHPCGATVFHISQTDERR